MSEGNKRKILAKFLAGEEITMLERLEIFDLAYAKYSMDGNYQ